VTGGSYRFGVLGPLTIERDGEVVELSGGHQRTLLALLLLSGDEPISRDRLIDELWGERPPATAVSALHVHLSKLRRALGDVVESTAAGYALPSSSYELDASRFDALVDQAGSDPVRAGGLLREALSLFRGQPLADVTWEGSLAQWRRALEEKRLHAIEQRIDADLAGGQTAELLPELARLIAEHPFEERLRGQQMLALARAGRQAEALEVYQATRSLLAEELGLDPGEGLKGLQRAILEQDPGVVGSRSPSVGKPPSNLPRPPNKLVGREEELAALRGLAADPDVRLITLTGPGGVGKTRLLIAFAELLAPEYKDGVVYVRLEQLTDPALVPEEIGTALGLRDGIEGVGADGLSGHLRRRELLLALDNFEQLLPAAVQVAELLSSAPDVRVVVTSRAPLRLRGEQVFEVEPLRVPGAEADAAPAQSPAVQLFLQGALAANRRLMIDRRLLEDVADICRLLDGLPLGIELAASRSGSMSPAEIARQLARPLEIGGPPLRDLPERQQTLEATIRWSYDILDARGAELLRRAGVFRGGFTAPALDAVAGRSSSSGLDDLVDASLVLRRAEGDRFALLELVRAFALTELEASGAGEQARERHRSYFAQMVGPAKEAFDGGGSPGEIAAPLMADHANLRVALENALDAGDADRALQLALGLRPVWHAGMLRQEAQDLTAHLLERFQIPATDEIALLRAASFLDHVDPTSVRNVSFTHRLAARAAELGDRTALAIATGNLLGDAINAGDVDEIRRLKPTLVELALGELDDQALAWIYYNLALESYVEGDYDMAWAHASRSAAACGDDQMTLAVAVATRLLAQSARDEAIAQPALAEALDLMRRFAIKTVAAFALWFVARYAAAVAPETAARWLVYAEQILADLDSRMWPESVLRDEAMAVLGIDDLGPLVASTPRVDHVVALDQAVAWVTERDPAESAPRHPSRLIAPASG
jgi:predicted ATPase/DNA-binding SARP family transcriptional activator